MSTLGNVGRPFGDQHLHILEADLIELEPKECARMDHFEPSFKVPVVWRRLFFIHTLLKSSRSHQTLDRQDRFGWLALLYLGCPDLPD